MVCISSVPTVAAVAETQNRGTPETWEIETGKQHYGQPVSVEVLRRTSGPIFKKDKVCATGNFSVSS